MTVEHHPAATMTANTTTNAFAFMLSSFQSERVEKTCWLI
jgi:hypothetical protein